MAAEGFDKDREDSYAGKYIVSSKVVINVLITDGEEQNRD